MPPARFYIRGVFWKTVIVQDKLVTSGSAVIFKGFDPTQMRITTFNFENTPEDITRFDCPDKEAFRLLESK